MVVKCSPVVTGSNDFARPFISKVLTASALRLCHRHHGVGVAVAYQPFTHSGNGTQATAVQ